MRLPGVRKLCSVSRKEDEEAESKRKDDAFLRDPEPVKIKYSSIVSSRRPISPGRLRGVFLAVAEVRPDCRIDRVFGGCKGLNLE